MRKLTPTEAAYVAGIIDGEGSIEFKRKERIRRDRMGSPTYNTLIVRLEVPQVHGVYRVLKQVLRYLIVKQEKAKLVVDHYDKQFKKKTYGKGGFGVK